MKDFLNYEIFRFGEDAVLKVNGVLYIVISFIIIWFTYRWVKRITNLAVRNGRIDPGRAYAVTRILRYLSIILFILIVLISLHVNWKIFAVLTPLLIGIGLGLQQVANDLVSGIILLIEPTIRVNDIVEVDSIVARVEEIGLRTSKVESRDGVTMIIPNHKLVSENLINWSNTDIVTRFKIKIGVAYGSDVELVRKLLLEVAWKHNKVVTNPAPIVFFKSFGDSSLDFELAFWSTHLFPIEQVQSELRFMIDKSFRENNVKIPFPQQDVHIISGNLPQ